MKGKQKNKKIIYCVKKDWNGKKKRPKKGGKGIEAPFDLSAYDTQTRREPRTSFA